MSDSIDNAFITQWNAEAKQAYQQMSSNIRKAVREVGGVTGNTYKFPTLGKGTAVSNKARHADLTPMNLAHDNATVILTTAHATEYLDDLDQVQTNLNARAEYTKAVMSAINRELEGRLVTALDETSVTVTTGSMNSTKIAALHKKLTAADVPTDGDRYLVISAGALEDMLDDSKIASNDYLSKDAYTKGFVPGVLGFNVVIVSDSILKSATASKHTCYAFHKSAVGLAVGKDVTFQIERVPTKDAWQVMAKMLCGAKIIEGAGVVKVEIDD